MSSDIPEREVILAAYARAAQRWERLADVLVRDVAARSQDLDTDTADLLVRLHDAQYATLGLQLVTAHADADTATWAQGMLERLLGQTVPMAPGIPDAPPAEPGPVEAHLGELVHYQDAADVGCQPALTTIPGPRPELTVFGEAELIHRAREVPHWEAATEAGPRWHCACECGQVQAARGGAPTP